MYEGDPMMKDVDANTQLNNPDLLRIAKDEAMRSSEERGTITVAGPIAAVAPDMTWGGSISPQQRLEQGVIGTERLVQAEAVVGRYYVDVITGAPIRCGDGRGIKGYAPDDAEWYGRPLGPELFGGSEGVALAHRIIEGVIEGTIVNDVSAVNGAIAEAGFSAGGHTDTANCDSENSCGCGAIDTIESQFERLDQPQYATGIRQLTQARLGDAFNQSHFDQAKERALAMRQDLSRYLVPGQQVLEAIRRDNPAAVEVLEGSHNEVLLNVNNVPGTTFHRDEFAAEFDTEVEAFNTDDYALWDIAKSLYPEDEDRQSLFVHAFMIKDAATLPGLIAEDGSLKVVIRTPN